MKAKERIKTQGSGSTSDNYRATLEKQYSYLDKIDIEKYIVNCTSGEIVDLMRIIEDDYDDTDLTNNDFLEGCIFNLCDEYEFVKYLEKRYGGRFHSHEQVVTRNTFSFDK